MRAGAPRRRVVGPHLHSAPYFSKRARSAMRCGPRYSGKASTPLIPPETGADHGQFFASALDEADAACGTEIHGPSRRNSASISLGGNFIRYPLAPRARECSKSLGLFEDDTTTIR